MKLFLAALAFAITMPTQALAQVNLPSEEEVSPLVTKADEKVSAFEEAMKSAKPWLDEMAPKLPTNYGLNAASAAHTIIQGIQTNGASASSLVALLATLDDVSLDAATASVQLLETDEVNISKGKRPDLRVLAAVVRLTNSGNACNDMAELILHVTLRYVTAEEAIIESVDKALGDKK
jgi:hypothetical protein